MRAPPLGIMQVLAVLLATLSVVSAGAGASPLRSEETLSKLEALVSSMASGQTGAVGRPATRPAEDAGDVVILEEGAEQKEGRKGVQACKCDIFESGATPLTAACYKESKDSTGKTQRVCHAMSVSLGEGGALCPSDSTACGLDSLVDRRELAASPVPGRALAEEEDAPVPQLRST